MLTIEDKYCTAQDIISLTGVKPSNLKFDKKEDPEGALEGILNKWITEAMALIDSYCHRSFTPADQVSWNVASSVCKRITANMVAFSQARRDTPLVKVNDWRVEVSSSEIFPKELREDLDPFVVEKSNKTDTVDFFTITGD